jgi:hypothetical protein
MKLRNPHLSILAAGAAAVLITVAFLASAGDAGAAPNLVANGTFDSGPAVGNWTAQSDTTIGQIPSEDADLNPASGALSISDDGGVANDAIATSDCIVLTGDASYDISAWYKSALGTSGSERGQVIVTLFDDAGCTTNAVAHPSGQLDPNSAGWQQFTGNVIVSGELSAIVEVTDEGATDVDDIIYWDNIALSNGPLDTPTPTVTNTPPPATDTPVPTDTPTATDTAVPTDTPAATNTPAPTDTPAPTNTPAPTDTPAAAPTDTPTPRPTATEPLPDTATPTGTNTPVPTSTNTPVPPPTEEGAPPQAPIDESTGGGSADSTGGDGVAGEGVVDGNGAELPEDAVDPEAVGALGYGPQARQHDDSGAADVVAMVAFGAAIAMLGLGFGLQFKGREEDER